MSDATCGHLVKVGTRSFHCKGTLFLGTVSEISMGNTLALHE